MLVPVLPGHWGFRYVRLLGVVTFASIRLRLLSHWAGLSAELFRLDGQFASGRLVRRHDRGNRNKIDGIETQAEKQSRRERIPAVCWIDKDYRGEGESRKSRCLAVQR